MYRNACDFRVDDSETLLNDRFLDFDDAYFVPRNIQISNAPSPLRRNFSSNYMEDPQRSPRRKSSQASISTEFSERSSEGPPRSYTSPSNVEFRPSSLKMQDTFPASYESQSRFKSNHPSALRLNIPPGSLPSPSFMTFTPPSVTSSLRNTSIKPFFSDPPPFSLASDQQPLENLKTIDSTDFSPPFALPGMNVCVLIADK